MENYKCFKKKKDWDFFDTGILFPKLFEYMCQTSILFKQGIRNLVIFATNKIFKNFGPFSDVKNVGCQK